MEKLWVLVVKSPALIEDVYASRAKKDVEKFAKKLLLSSAFDKKILKKAVAA
jgi:hypothetical protein